MTNLDSVSLYIQTPLHVTGCPMHGERTGYYREDLPCKWHTVLCSAVIADMSETPESLYFYLYWGFCVWF